MKNSNVVTKEQKLEQQCRHEEEIASHERRYKEQQRRNQVLKEPNHGTDYGRRPGESI